MPRYLQLIGIRFRALLGKKDTIMTRTSVAIIVNLLLAFCAAAQTQEPVPGNLTSTPTATRAQTQIAKVREGDAARRRFWLSLSLSSAFDTNISHDVESLSSFGLVPSFGVHFRDNP
jgi:hypothetical protein